MTRLFDPVLELARPLASPFLPLAVTLLMAAAVRRHWSARRIAAALVLTAGLFLPAYGLACRAPAVERWLAALESPLFAVFLLIVLPAMTLPRGRFYRVFLVVPAATLLVAVSGVIENYIRYSPPEFCWFPLRPAWLMGGAASLLVLLQPLLTLRRFRFAVRLACFLVLTYGGCALRASYADYREAMDRRFDPSNPPGGVVTLTDTRPALQSDRRMTYLPSAPCRFSADGGYVQGCNMEMAQRLLQVDETKAAAGDAGALHAFSLLLGALTMFVVLSFLIGRALCGWLCPLSAMGGAIDWLRRLLRLPHLKPAAPLKLGLLFSGLGISSVALAMAKAYPHLDADGRFAGCKIPLYPFCKICPSQPICSVVGRGSAAYAPLPELDLGFGFFTTLYVALLLLFAAGFATGRRLWCRFCPMGMISGLFNRGGMLRLAKEPVRCNRCGVCAEVCPMDIDRPRAEMSSRDVGCFDCVLCGRCVEHCPRNGCLAMEISGIRVVESRFDGKTA